MIILSREISIWGVILLYAVFIVGTGIYYSKKSNDMASFTVGGRSAGAWISALSYGTAYFSAVMFIGYAGGSGWSFGLWAILIGVGNALFGTLLPWIVLADKTRAITRQHRIKSMPQLFELRFKCTNMKYFSCFIIFFFLTPYSASVYKGLTSVCSIVLGIDANISMIIIALASAAILILGGYTAMLKSDFIQGFIMIIGVSLLIVLVVSSSAVGGISVGFNNMVDYMKNHEMMPLNSTGTLSLISLILMTSFGTWGLPQMVHKYYGIKDKTEVKRGAIISTFFALLIAGGGYLIGSLSHLFFGSDLPAGGTDFLVPLMLNMAGLPDILLGVILVLLISASVSTLSGITLTACSTLSMDFIKARFKADMSSEATAKLTKILCLLFVAVSYAIAVSNTPIIQLMSYSWGIISGSFLAPYLLTLYWKGINKFGAWCGILVGFSVAFIPALLSGFTSPNGPLFACLAILSSFIFCFVGSKLSTKFNLQSSMTNNEFYVID